MRAAPGSGNDLPTDHDKTMIKVAVLAVQLQRNVLADFCAGPSLAGGLDSAAS